MNLQYKCLWCLPTFGNSLTCHSITLANFNLSVEQQQNVKYIKTEYFEFGITKWISSSAQNRGIIDYDASDAMHWGAKA